MAKTKFKTFLALSDTHRIAFEGVPVAKTNDFFEIRHKGKRAFVNKIEYLKMMN